MTGERAGLAWESLWQDFGAARLTGTYWLGGASTPIPMQAGCATPSFIQASGSPIAVGNNPHYVGLGLFNADNQLDIVTTNYDENTVTILLGNGMGGFTVTPGSPISVGTGPVTAEVGDFNNDNKADIAVSNQGSNDVTILLGNGDGSFTPASGSPIAVGTNPRAVAKGSFNSDANLDLVVSNGGSSDLTILLGNGDGTFTPAAGSPIAAGFATFHTVVADFNHDTKNDLAVANFGEGSVRIYLGNGSGGFTQAGMPISVGNFTSFIAVGLFNGDAHLDLAVTNRADANLVILLGDGSGGFSQASGSPYSVGNAPVAVAAGDVNLDGKLDLAVANEQSATASILLGNGSGGFGPATPLDKGLFPTHLALADFNGDNKLDVAAPNGGDDNVTILLNTCGACPAITVNPATIPSGVAGTAYSQTFTQVGGVGTITFSLTGTLPAGLSFAGATLSGTPTQTGSFPITVKATDANNCTGMRDYTLVINCQTITVNPATIPDGTAGVAYSQTFTQTGGIGTVIFTLTGTLPTGLSFTGATLSGTTTQTGSFPITVTATDANNCTGSRNYTLVINNAPCPTITVNPATIPAGIAGAAYSQTFTQTGGAGTITFSQLGTLPAGMTFSGATLSGTPTQTGSFPITIKATDVNGCMGTRDYTLVINCQTITVNPATTSAGTAGTAYTQTFTQTGGIGTTTFSLTGTLPTGLSFAGATLSGTPTQTGSFPITVKATDANGCMGTRGYTLVINCQTITVNPATIPSGTVGAAYSQTFTHTGGIGTTTFALTGTLPAGLSFAGATLSGTPTQTGSFPITVKATDANGCMGTRDYTLVIGCQTITVNPATIPSGTAGTTYSQTFTQGGGIGTVAFSVIGTLPTGLTFVGATLSGTPTQTGNFPITVKATDGNGCVGTRDYLLVVNCPTITVNPATIPAGAVGTAYSQTFTQSGGLGTITFSVTGILPTGLSFAGAALSGTPTQTGSFPITVTATDANNCTGSRNYTLVINCRTITVGPVTIPSGAVGTTYSQVFTQSGGIGTTTFDLAGKLPTGLTFSGATLSGTPTQSGSFPITVSVTDANGCTGSRNYTLLINCQTISVTPATILAGTVGAAYSQSFTQNGGTGTTTFALAGKLPAGITFSGATLSGTPTQSGNFPITVTVTDANNCTGSRNYTLAINCQTITVNPAALPAGSTGTAYSQTFTHTGGIGTVSFALTGTLPAGLTFSSGTLSGTPTQQGSFPITITATDANNCTGVRNYTLAINCPNITVNPATIPAGITGVAYSQTFTQTSGSGTITFSLSSGIVPQGMSLSAGGVLSGIPSNFGVFAFTVRATAANGCFGERQYNLRVCPVITLGPATLPVGTVSAAYSQTLSVNGGGSPYAFSVAAGMLPNGLALDPASGVLGGTPTLAGKFSFTVRADDANGCAGLRDYTVVINCQTITVNPPTLPNGFVGTAYDQTLTANGGIAPNAFAVSGGALPDGLTLTSVGVLAGTPTTPGTFTFTITATDAGGCTGSRQYTVIISGKGPNSLVFYPLAHPVRLLETRAGFTGCSAPGVPIPGGTSLTQVARGTCDGLVIPSNAAAITGNITTVQSGGGFLTLYPSGAAQPVVANSNYGPNEIVNNVFTVGLGASDGAFKIFVQNTTHVVVDVTGYYAPPGAGGLYFHPLPKPIRLLETRPGFSGCTMPGVPIPGGADALQQARLTCDGVTIPAAALAIVGNATTVGPAGAGFLTLFPADVARPLAASSNYGANQIVNGPFTVGLSAAGQFKIFSSATTHLVVDVIGYYSTEATDANGAGLLFNPLSKPVRLLETRAGFTGCFAPGAPITGNTEVTQPARGTCNGETVPASALAVVGNATVVNSNGGFLTLWPSNAARPTAAASNFNTGQIVNRHFTVGLGPDGAFKIYSQFTTDLVIDLSGFFAP